MSVLMLWKALGWMYLSWMKLERTEGRNPLGVVNLKTGNKKKHCSIHLHSYTSGTGH